MTIAAIGHGEGYSILVTDDVVCTAQGQCRRDKIYCVSSGIYATCVGDDLVLAALNWLVTWKEPETLNFRDSKTIASILEIAERLRKIHKARGTTLMPTTGTSLIVCKHDEALYWSAQFDHETGVFNRPSTPVIIKKNEFTIFYGSTTHHQTPLLSCPTSPFSHIIKRMAEVDTTQREEGKGLPYKWDQERMSCVRVSQSKPAERKRPFGKIMECVLMQDPGEHHLVADDAFMDVSIPLPWRSTGSVVRARKHS